MSDDYLSLLLARMHQDIANLSKRVDALEAEMDGEDDAPASYLDGNPA